LTRCGLEGIAMSMNFMKHRSILSGLAAALLTSVLFLATVETAPAQPPRPGPRGQWEYRDMRYHHNRAYPYRGRHIRVLPPRHRVVVYGGLSYYFSDGAWYLPSGPNFVVVAPPVGLIVPFLPPYHTTVWVGRTPYYYANEVYYVNRGNGYVVVAPPKEEASQAPPAADELFVYPRQGQSEQQQADDRYACHRWAVDQTGFDPTQPPGASTANKVRKDRADYQRAMAACLDGRGYTVK